MFRILIPVLAVFFLLSCQKEEPASYADLKVSFVFFPSQDGYIEPPHSAVLFIFDRSSNITSCLNIPSHYLLSGDVLTLKSVDKLSSRILILTDDTAMEVVSSNQTNLAGVIEVLNNEDNHTGVWLGISSITWVIDDDNYYHKIPLFHQYPSLIVSEYLK